MLNWFEKSAPIRTKFKALQLALSAFAAISLTAIILLGSGAVSQGVAIALGVVALALTTSTITIAAKLVCTPYVNTVVRMEALADGDTRNEIQYVDYKDCVGRMTKAMAIFRDNAVEVQRSREAQRIVVESLTTALKALADNDLTCQIDQQFPGEYEALRQDFNRAVASLSSALETVSRSAHSVQTGAREIHTASDDLSQRNEQQAATLEETSAAMNQVTQGVNSTAEAAAHAQQTIADAHREANEGGVVVERAVDAMSAIEQSSEKINQIIGVIDGIAFQTNLLALNAGVEAARAGDAGKGFAVVATEVRALAQRSADAARDIAALITESSKQVSAGVDFVGETGTLLSTIVTRIGEINSVMTEISVSAQAQAASLQQVNSAVGDMDRLTQQNAAMVEESTAAARSLADEAGELSRVVGQFRTGAAVDIRLAAKTVRPPLASVPVRKKAAGLGNVALSVVHSAEDWSEF